MLSEITENLTYRLLDLEERLIAAEQQLGRLRADGAAGEALPEAMERWLQDTEARIARVEDLLIAGATVRQATGSPAGQAVAAATGQAPAGPVAAGVTARRRSGPRSEAAPGPEGQAGGGAWAGAPAAGPATPRQVPLIQRHSA